MNVFKKIQQTVLNNPSHRLSQQTFFVFVMILACGSQLITSTRIFFDRYQAMSSVSFVFKGEEFASFKPSIKDISFVGYYTDKDLSNRFVENYVVQARYVLAPAILDPNSANHDYIFFDCESRETALSKMEEMKMIPILENKHGIILAKREDLL